jgi:hypothetical protein
MYNRSLIQRLWTICLLTPENDVYNINRIVKLRKILLRNESDAMYWLKLSKDQYRPGTWLVSGSSNVTSIVDNIIKDAAIFSSPTMRRIIDRILRKPDNPWMFDGTNVRRKAHQNESSIYGCYPTKETCEKFGCEMPVL